MTVAIAIPASVLPGRICATSSWPAKSWGTGWHRSTTCDFWSDSLGRFAKQLAAAVSASWWRRYAINRCTRRCREPFKGFSSGLAYTFPRMRVDRRLPFLIGVIALLALFIDGFAYIYQAATNQPLTGNIHGIPTLNIGFLGFSPH